MLLKTLRYRPTSGEIAGSRVHDASISVAVARFERSRLRHAGTAVQGVHDSWQAGARLARQLDAPGLRAVFVLSDGLNVNGTPLVAGLAQNLPQGVAISGGLAGDGSRFARTWVLAGAAPRQQHIAAVGFYGEHLRVGHGHDGGWSDFGPEWRITRAAGNVLYELDGKPALDLYKAYLGERAAGHVGFYSYGEIAPALSGGSSDLHNQTMTVTVFSEAAAADAAA